ncbi:MAG: hypothetical protein A3F42_03385 [Gammaproteobacteria bacterium RIFCSPHIGHO2_12_FULL_37_34]|nr:MAG: hypothetical protein A3F42_03385 [Gammaproteobacteria bacterium RIFCSPHIGHO2_12_FULL_37_34]
MNQRYIVMIVASFISLHAIAESIPPNVQMPTTPVAKQISEEKQTTIVDDGGSLKIIEKPIPSVSIPINRAAVPPPADATQIMEQNKTTTQSPASTISPTQSSTSQTPFIIQPPPSPPPPPPPVEFKQFSPLPESISGNPSTPANR